MPPMPAVSSPQSSVLRQSSPGTPNRRPTSIRIEDQHKSRLAEQEQIDRLKAEAAAKEKKEKKKAEAERKAKVAEEIHKLEEAARLEKEQKEQRRKQEEERLRKGAEAQELQRLKKKEERRLKLKQGGERILKAKQEEKALRLAQERERAKEEKERKEKEEREEQERLSKLAEETRLCLEEEAAAKAKAEAISEPKPEEREEAELKAYKGPWKQDGQLEDGRDVDTETFKTMEDGRDKPEDGLHIDTTSIHSNHAVSVGGALGMQFTSIRPSTMQRTASQDGGGAPLQKRVPGKCGENRDERNRVPREPQMQPQMQPQIHQPMRCYVSWKSIYYCSPYLMFLFKKETIPLFGAFLKSSS